MSKVTLTNMCMIYDQDTNKVLVQERMKSWKGISFPGGKVEDGETLSQALMRECAEELAIHVDVGDPFMQVTHNYPDILIRLTLFHCTIHDGFPQALEHNAIKWIHPSQIDNYEFCPADEDILKEIKRIYQNRKPL